MAAFRTEPVRLRSLPLQPVQLLFILQQGTVLPDLAVTQHIFLTARQHVGRAVVERIGLISEEQLLPAFRENIQIPLHQIEVVGPVIGPETFPEGGFDVLLRQGQHSAQEFLLACLQRDAMVGNVIDQPSGSEPACTELHQLLLVIGSCRVNPFRKLRRLARQDFKGGSLHTQRIVAIRLDQAVEHLDIEAADPGIEEYIIAPVLVHVAEIPVTLGVIFRRQREKVVVALHVPMLAREEMHDSAFSPVVEYEWITAAQEIVQVGLPAVGIKYRRGGTGCNVLRQPVGQAGRFQGFGRNIFITAEGFRFPVDFINVVHMPNNGVQDQLAARSEGPGRAAEAAGNFVDGVLGLCKQLCQLQAGKPLREAKRSIASEHRLEVHNRCQPLSFRRKRQVEMAAADFADLRIIIRAGAQLVERNSVLQIVYLHPAAQQIADLLISAVLHTVRQDLRQTVQHFKLKLPASSILNLHTPDQCRVVITRQIEVVDGCL
ncbi:hypothetical protein D3C73_657320 [compost metagenome]